VPFIICGRARSGKSGLLKVLALEADRIKEKSMCCIAECGERDLLRSFALDNHISYYRRAADLEEMCMAAEKSLKDGLTFIFIEDLAAFMNVICGSEGIRKSLPQLFGNIMQQQKKGKLFLAATVNARLVQGGRDSGGLYEDFLAGGCGIHLGGMADGQRLLSFDGISWSELSDRLPPGHGFITLPGMTKARPVTVPYV
jgi:hypothetical protein